MLEHCDHLTLFPGQGKDSFHKIQKNNGEGVVTNQVLNAKTYRSVFHLSQVSHPLFPIRLFEV